MRFLARWLTSKSFWVFVGVVILSFLVWWTGPLFAFGDWRPLESDRAQWTVIGTLFALFVLWLLIRWWREKNINARLLNQLAKAQTAAAPAAETPDGAEQVAELRKRFQTALGVLKNARLSKQETGRFARLSGQYTYQLPWYIFIGSPGSGKTTALINSGLEFPLAEQFGKAAIRGVGGTRNCDWWFTNEAVMIDTAGRYTTQESNELLDKAEWEGFLKLLRRFRPRQPINGVLLTVSVAELLSQTAAERLLHVSVLKQRLEDLRTALGIQFPVYVLVTKVDLLAGFTEYFDTLTRDERAQVWGFTFPYAPNAEATSNFLQTFRNEFGSLLQRLYAAVPELLLSKRDLQARALAYAFPQQFAGLEDILEQFLAPLFATSRFRDPPLMRGVYFTSGTQEGTPFDRVLSALEHKFSVESRVRATTALSGGKSYFLQNLLEQVVFAESHLAGRNWRLEKWRNLLRIAGYACVAILLIGAAAGWLTSYRNNIAYLKIVDQRTGELANLITDKARDGGDDPSEIVPLLEGAYTLGQPPGFAVNDPPMGYRFGLYQGYKVDIAATSAYDQLLKEAFRPRVAKRMENALRDTPVDNPGSMYQRLQAYLMFQDQKHYDAKLLKASAVADLDVGSDVDADRHKQWRDELERHLGNLFEKRLISYPIDSSLVQERRQRLASLPPAQRTYERIKDQLGQSQFPDFRLSDHYGDKGPLVLTRATGDSETHGVPGLFTLRGYQDGFNARVGPLALSIGSEEAWVLGEAPKTLAQQASAVRDRVDSSRLVAQVKQLYMDDYVREWDKFLDDIQLRPITSINDSIAFTEILASRSSSPLPILLRAIAHETTLLPEEKTAGTDSIVQQATGRIVSRGKDIIRNRTSIDMSTSAPSAPRARPEATVDNHFADLHRLVQTPAQGKAPIDDTLELFASLHRFFINTETAKRENRTPPPSDPLTLASSSSDPPPIRQMLAKLAGAGSGQVDAITRGSINATIDGAVGDPCRRAIAGRYPFFRDSGTDVRLDDFARLFSPNGVFDAFFQKNLVEKVNTSTKPWTLKEGSGSTARTLPNLAAFKNAADIRDAYFRGASADASFQVDIRARSIDPSIKEVVLIIDGQVLSFAGTSSPARTLKWPAAGGSGSARLQALPETTAPAFEASGLWALHRLFSRARIAEGGGPESFRATFMFGARPVEFEVTARSVFNPLHLAALNLFRCPAKP